MKINVMNKTERLEFGKIIEFRGNFIEEVNEEGDTSYSCDMYRTTNKNDTFESLYLAEQKQENIAYMSATNYISSNYSDSIDKTAFLNEKSEQFGVLNSVIIAKRRAIHATLNIS
jgi:hypothetical protein